MEQIFCVHSDFKERRKLSVVFVVVKKSSTGFILYSLGDLNRIDKKRGWLKAGRLGFTNFVLQQIAYTSSVRLI